MIHNLRGKLVTLILIFSFILIPIRISGEEEYLIVRIIDAEYPLKAFKNKDNNSTIFEFNLYYQLVNPTSSEITIQYLCAPFPFPYIRADLNDEELKVQLIFWVVWISGDVTYSPGSITELFSFAFEIINYVNESLPLGIFELWFDHTNCSSSPVPVITERMFIEVTEARITYYFNYNNEARIVSPKITLTANFPLVSLILSLLCSKAIKIRLTRKKRRKQKINLNNIW